MDAQLTRAYAGIDGTGVPTFLSSPLLPFHILPFSYPLPLLPSHNIFLPSPPLFFP